MRMSFWILMLAMAPAAAEDFRPEILLTPEVAGQPRQVAVVGIWPDSCVPVIAESRFENGELILVTEHGGADCRPAPTRYTLATMLDGAEPGSPGVYPVRVFSRAPDDPLLRLIAFDLISLGDRPTDFEPESGIWWPLSKGANPTAGPGIGFALEFQSRAMVMLANMYDPFGNPMWMIGTGTLDGRLVRTDLLTFSGGQPMFSRYSPPRSAVIQARAYIQFHGRAEATLWLSAPREERVGTELLLQPIALARYAFGYASGAFAFSGRWVLVHGDEATRLRLLPDLTRRTGGSGLRDPDRDLSLRCDTSDAAAPPSACRLLDRDGTEVVTFNELGLNRMGGIHADGQRVDAFRIDQ